MLIGFTSSVGVNPITNVFGIQKRNQTSSGVNPITILIFKKYIVAFTTKFYNEQFIAVFTTKFYNF